MLKAITVFEGYYIKVLLYDSVTKTGMGHGTDIAILFGLSGDRPVAFDVNNTENQVQYIKVESWLILNTS